jgi:hypothetical protein
LVAGSPDARVSTVSRKIAHTLYVYQNNCTASLACVSPVITVSLER